MEYSLYYLNKLCTLKNLKLNEIIDKLNLIGFEVDDIYQENIETNSFIKHIRLLLKIPANREDLLIETIFLKELYRLFSLENISKWQYLKESYLFLLKQQYYSHYQYNFYDIESNIEDILIYNVHIKIKNEFVSPKWLQQKLKNNGIQPLNNLNDLINLVSFEWGQTLNVSVNNNFSSSFYVEQLKKEEKFTNEITFPVNSIVLKNNLNQIENCLGYISPISTENLSNKIINLQAIFYDIHLNPLNISIVNTKLSTRYLRKTFLQFFRISIQRFLTILELISEDCNILINHYKTKSKKIKIESPNLLKLKKVSIKNFLNIEITDLHILKKTGLSLVCETTKDFYFEIPNTRKDLTREIDLIEEYSRFIGYKNFNEILPKKIGLINNNKTNRYKFLKQFFINLGFNEIINSSIEEKKKEIKTSVLLSNPLNNDFFLLRSNLSTKMLEIFENNLRIGFLHNNFFEIGRIFKQINNKIIEEDRFVAIFEPLFGKNENVFGVDWYVNKGFIESLFRFFGHNQLLIEPIKNISSLYHPTKTCLFKKNNRILGIFGEINPSFLSTKKSVYLIELNLSEFQDSQLSSKINFSKELSKYPSITKDLSFLIDKNVDFVNIQNYLENATRNLKNFYFFDIYFQNLTSSMINIGIRFEFQSDNETLTNIQIEKEIEIIKNLLKTKFNIIINN